MKIVHKVQNKNIEKLFKNPLKLFKTIRDGIGHASAAAPKLRTQKSLKKVIKVIKDIYSPSLTGLHTQ